MDSPGLRGNNTEPDGPTDTAMDESKFLAIEPRRVGLETTRVDGLVLVATTAAATCFAPVTVAVGAVGVLPPVVP